jgi:cell division protein FtsQ
MRFVPNRLKVEIHERTPVAFARVGPRIALIDAGGTLMELSSKHKYSFPVILGMNPGEPLSTRAPRMKEYAELVRDLDSGGARYSQDLSEVDLTDLDDVKVRVNDAAGDVLVHLGSSEYLRRYRIYVTHAQQWRQQFQKLESVDLRYDNQIVVNPDLPRPPRQAVLSPVSAKAAVAAGVKPAALVTRIGPHDRAVPKPAFELPEKKLNPNTVSKPAAKKPVRNAGKPKRRKPAKAGSTAKKPAAKTVVTAAATPQPSPVGGSKPVPPAAKAGVPAAAGGKSQKPSPAIAKTQTNQGPAD